jgi:CubicO group peptidase (beta-lactamase class C family)
MRMATRQTGGCLTGPNPTDRGKPGSKHHLLVDRLGMHCLCKGRHASYSRRSQPRTVGQIPDLDSSVIVRKLRPLRARREQASRRRWLRRSLLGAAALLVIFGILALSLFTWAWLSTDRSTIARALFWREADLGDQHRFPSRPIPASGHAGALLAGSRVDLRIAVPDGDNGTARLGDVLRGTDTHAFVVIHQDRVVYERYDGGSGPKTLETSFSVAKSFVSALVGIAIDQGRIGSVDDPVTRYLPELAARDARFKQITLRDLLTMSSGLRYQESSGPWLWGDDTTTYYGVDLRKDALQHTQIQQTPGKRWHYNNYNPLLLGLVLERATGMTVADFMASRLWQPLGAGSDASWSLDSRRSRFEKMESGLNATALDYARFGLLFLHGGEWNGRRIVSSEWVRAATRAQTATDFPNPYGYFWWIDGKRPDRFYAFGNYGQYIYVDPHADAVVVRLGSDWGFGNEQWLATFRAIADQLAGGVH